MKTSRLLIFLIILLLVASLTACKKPLEPPESAQTPQTSPPDSIQPTATKVIDTLYLNATQTALAMSPGLETPQATAPDVPLDATEPVTNDTPVAPPPTATQPPPVVGPVPEITVPASYTLNKGEFPYCIARRFNVDPAELLNLNGLANGDVYYPNLTLNIPQTGNPFPGTRARQSHPDTYNVADASLTLYGIACVYGDVDPAAIAQANNLQLTSTLTVGQQLTIP